MANAPVAMDIMFLLVTIPESSVIAKRFSQRMWCVMVATGEGIAATVGARRATVRIRRRWRRQQSSAPLGAHRWGRRSGGKPACIGGSSPQ